ncbi:MAG: YegP family protein [Actinomycetota bacterium]|nr:YegP family protein [Actinomycetota bacterium]
MAQARFEIFADAAGKYRWRLKDVNGEKVATSGESFDSRSNAKRAAQNVKLTAPDAVVDD